VYDVTRRETFSNIEVWLNELNQYAGAQEVVKMLVGNKSDLACGAFHSGFCWLAIHKASGVA
jgi:GTPase SAR1 family protein